MSADKKPRPPFAEAAKLHAEELYQQRRQRAFDTGFHLHRRELSAGENHPGCLNSDADCITVRSAILANRLEGNPVTLQFLSDWVGLSSYYVAKSLAYVPHYRIASQPDIVQVEEFREQLQALKKKSRRPVALTKAERSRKAQLAGAEYQAIVAEVHRVQLLLRDITGKIPRNYAEFHKALSFALKSKQLDSDTAINANALASKHPEILLNQQQD